jgi:AbrB family looped-hinge helix DNA binding protein
MKSIIDTVGRVAIPKTLRAKLGLHSGHKVEIRARDGRLEIDPAPTPMKLVRRRGGRVAVPGRKLPPLTDEIVRDMIEQIRR